MTLGEKLLELRRERGISQEQLAAYINVSRQAVSKWELNESMPDTSNIIQLSGLFNVTADYLLIEDSPRHTPRTLDDGICSRRSGDFKIMEKVDGWEVISMCLACVGVFIMLLALDSEIALLIPGAIIDAVGLTFFNKLQKDKHRRWNWSMFIFGQLALPIASTMFIITFFIGAFNVFDYIYVDDCGWFSAFHGIIGGGIAFLMWGVPYFLRKPSRPSHDEKTYTSPAEAPNGYVKLQ